MSGAARVIAGVSGSPGSLPTLRHAADLARSHDATLTPVLAWTSPGGDIAECHSPSPILRQIWKDAAWQRLWDAFDAAFGGVPADLRAEPLVQRGEAGCALVNAASRTDDLLVVGTGRRGTLGRLRHGKVSRSCLAHARCPVLAIPASASPLEQAAGHGLHGWTFRRRGHLRGRNVASHPSVPR
ncbi:MAG: universal stress protein [Streptosporangiaceae bacterium]